VDTSACRTAAVPESLVRGEVRRLVEELDRAEGRFRQRAAPRVEIDAQGIHVALRFVIVIDNFADPDLNIDFVIGLRVRDGAVEAFYKSFSVDVDWPWWVTVISAGASEIVESVIAGRIEQGLKPQLLAEINKLVERFVSQLPRSLRLHSITSAQDEIRVTACPANGVAPFLVEAPASITADAVG